MSSTDVIPDTHILKMLVRDERLRKEFLKKIEEKCFNLVLAPLESEYRARIGVKLSYLKLLFKTADELKGKFVQEESIRPIECRLKRGDKKLAGTAVRRAEKSGNAIIITEDPDFRKHQCLHILNRHNVNVLTLEEFRQYDP